jgi:hypothetical protein
LKNLDAMARPRIDAGWSFIIAGALASSVAGHRVIEALGERSAPIAATYGAYRHVVVGPAIIIAVVLAILVSCAILRERCRPSFGRNDDLAREAIAVVRMRPLVVVAVTIGLQFGLLYAMESVEHLLAFGTLAQRLDWLGGSVPVALVVHVGLACLTAAGIRRGCRDIATTCDRVLAFVDALVAFLRRLLARNVAARPLQRRRPVFAVIPRNARRHGLRAPPVLS